jgi:sec-independent protein translocase protein TatC
MSTPYVSSINSVDKFSLHLLELRYRASYIFLSYFITFLISTYYSPELTYLICVPFSKEGGQDAQVPRQTNFIFTELTEGLYTAIRVSFISALYLSMPLIIYQVRSFFIPSCFQWERKKIDWMLAMIITSFLMSIFFAFQFILPKICVFLQQYELENRFIQIKLQARIVSAVNWSLTTFFVTIILFQIPVIFVLLCSLYPHGKMATQLATFLIKNRKYAFLLLLLIASFFSPPDISIQCVLAATGYFFYESFIWYSLTQEKWRLQRSTLDCSVS